MAKHVIPWLPVGLGALFMWALDKYGPSDASWAPYVWAAIAAYAVVTLITRPIVAKPLSLWRKKAPVLTAVLVFLVSGSFCTLVFWATKAPTEQPVTQISLECSREWAPNEIPITGKLATLYVDSVGSLLKMGLQVIPGRAGDRVTYGKNNTPPPAIKCTVINEAASTLLGVKLIVNTRFRRDVPDEKSQGSRAGAVFAELQYPIEIARVDAHGVFLFFIQNADTGWAVVEFDGKASGQLAGDDETKGVQVMRQQGPQFWPVSLPPTANTSPDK